MANESAWNSGFDLAAERVQERRAHKQALSDEELQGKIQDLIGQRKALVSKISTLQQDSPEYTQAHDALKQVNMNLVDTYHPAHNAGAIERLGHLLTDHLKITSPEQRQQKQQAQLATKGKNAETQTQAEIAAGPLSPEQTATTEARANAAANLVAFQSKLKLWDQQNPRASAPDATPEEKQTRQDYINTLLQSTTKASIDAWTAVKGVPPEKLPDGSYRELQVNKKGEYRYQELPGGYTPPPPVLKPGTSKFSVNVESYRQLHNIPEGQALTPGQLNFIEQQMALSSAAPSTNITTSVKQDANGMYVPVTESNRHIPGFGTILSDPLGGTTDGSSGRPQASPNRGAASGQNGKGTPTAGGGNTKVGAPLFQGSTPAIKKAQTDVVEATKLDSLAAQVAVKPNDAINQKRLAVSLEKMSAGRFTTQALDYVIKAGWGNTIEQWANNPSTGALPTDVLRQLVDGAHENLKASRTALQAAMTPVGAASNAGGGTGTAHYVGEQVKLRNGRTITISVVYPDGSFE